MFHSCQEHATHRILVFAFEQLREPGFVDVFRAICAFACQRRRRHHCSEIEMDFLGFADIGNQVQVWTPTGQ